MKAIEKYVLLSTQQRARSRRRGRTNKLSNTRRRRKEEKEEEEEKKKKKKKKKKGAKFLLLKSEKERTFARLVSRRKRNVPSSIVFVVRIRAKPKYVGIGDTSCHLDFHGLFLLRHFCG